MGWIRKETTEFTCPSWIESYETCKSTVSVLVSGCSWKDCILALQGFCLPGDIWQCLTAFWVVTARGGWYSWHLVGKGQGSAYHPTMHWSASPTHTTQNHLAPNVSSAWSTGTFNVNLSPPQDDLFARMKLIVKTGILVQPQQQKQQLPFIPTCLNKPNPI